MMLSFRTGFAALHHKQENAANVAWLDDAGQVGLNRVQSGRKPMRTTQSLSVTLPIEMAKMVKDKVLSGDYASESEVIRDGLRSLMARDAAIEKWLVEEVVPTYDAVMAGTEPLLTAEESIMQLRQYMNERLASKRASSPVSE
jgi:antitoxin ParD1/3/4